MSNGTDDYLEDIELFLGRIWNFNSIVYLFSLLHNGAFLYVIIWTSAWALNQQFLMLKIKCQDPNLKFNCLHNQTLLFNLSFWKALLWRFILPAKFHICIRVLVTIPYNILLTLIAVVCIMCPLLDIILHYPLFIIGLQRIRKLLSFWRRPEYSIFLDDEKDDSNTRTVNTGSFKFTMCNFSQCRPSVIVVISKVLALLYYITIFVAYIYPIATVCSMIASYTIVGIMKNWDSLLPKLVLVGIAFSFLVKLLFGAYQPLHDLQREIYKIHQKMSPEFKELKEKFEQLNDLIKDGRVGFPDVNELLIGFPKLNSFIEQKDGNHYIRLPKIYEWMAVFPSLKDLLTFKDGNFFYLFRGYLMSSISSKSSYWKKMVIIM